MEKGKADSFGTFLEQVKRYNNIGQQRTPAPRQAEDDQKPGNVLLRIVSGAGPLTVSELMRESSLGFSEFADALKSIQQADLVSLESRDGDELVKLTEKGERVAAFVS